MLEGDGTPDKRKRIFFRIAISGFGAQPPSDVRLRLHVATVGGADSVFGGLVSTVGACSWDELTMTWNTQPPIDGPVVSFVGGVQRGDTVEFRLTPAIVGDGAYCFALETPSTDDVVYYSRDARGFLPRGLLPEVVLTP